MGWFDKDPAQEQLDIYSDLLSEKQSQLEELQGVETAGAGMERESLQEEIQEIQINIEQVREGMEQSKGLNLNDMDD